MQKKIPSPFLASDKIANNSVAPGTDVQSLMSPNDLIDTDTVVKTSEKYKDLFETLFSDKKNKKEANGSYN